MSEIGAVVLAAGRASRFGAGADDSKVLARLDGKPLVRHVAEAALASRARPVVVVIGHAGAGVRAALDGLDATIVDNPHAASGMAGSLKAGVAALPADCAGALILLADMPRVRARTLDALIAAYAAGDRRPDAVAPVFAGRRGNPVLLGRALFGAVAGLEGDVGARALLAEADVREIEVDDPGVSIDIDTRAALRAAGSI
jgi:molybdenum cofactor cytidylyltransferase